MLMPVTELSLLSFVVTHNGIETNPTCLFVPVTWDLAMQGGLGGPGSVGRGCYGVTHGTAHLPQPKRVRRQQRCSRRCTVLVSRSRTRRMASGAELGSCIAAANEDTTAGPRCALDAENRKPLEARSAAPKEWRVKQYACVRFRSGT